MPAIVLLVEAGGHMLRPMRLLLRAVVTVHDLLPILIFHDGVSLPDQRAEGRGIDGLAAVDAGLDGEEQRTGFVELGFALLDDFQLRVHDCAKVHVAARRQLADLREAEAGALER